MLSEFLGTFVLIMFGLGCVAVAVVGLPGSGRQTVDFGPANWLIIGWGWGLAVVFGVYVAGGVSGAHINPAVTLAFAVRRGFPWRKVPAYWLAQVVGAFAAAALIYSVYYPAIDAYNATKGIASRAASQDTFSIFATFPAKYFGGALWGPLFDQIVGTALLVALIAAIVDNRNQAPTGNMGGFIIGLVVVGIGFSFGTDAGYAINPARDLGPRLWTYIEGWGALAFPGAGTYFDNYWWVPIVGPLVGAVIGIVVYDLIIGQVLEARAEAAGGEEPPPPPGRTGDGVDSADVPAQSRAEATVQERLGPEQV
ncbi:aquaporin family protein [Actinomycetospora endophytica]|uniref:Aquaporin family protein n=1 Tax=Actinomycetospora endophytica TaxID=2291215 RepID=A0ABS8PGM3_9PSEU|nr:MIP/aquaporin family protein [Actinomycetospora endophytica]MCD2197406.1 aquaporin family protein [Actinomycetospora endophytica]